MAATILLVEDDPILRDTLKEAIEFAGHAVIPAPNGRVALEVRTRAHVDLIITDFTMPDIDGLTLVKKLREAGDPTPVIVTSAAPIPSELRREVPSIQKPFDLDDLYRLIETYIAHRRG
jgi:DNA-binding NtrC family response regulator